MQPIFITWGFTIEPGDMLERMGLETHSEEARDFLALAGELFEAAERCADCGQGGPGAVYLRTPVRYVGGGGRVVLGETAFTGTLLARNLLGIEWVYPHIATCGPALEERLDAIANPLRRYWADEIVRHMLQSGAQSARQDIAGRFNETNLSFMGPGGSPGWDLEGQTGLFALLDKAAEELGVTLGPDLTMRPLKSVSGIFFPGPENWSHCAGCNRDRCPGRRTGGGGGCTGCKCSLKEK